MTLGKRELLLATKRVELILVDMTGVKRLVMGSVLPLGITLVLTE
jgi:hypothetical protein